MIGFESFMLWNVALPSFEGHVVAMLLIIPIYWIADHWFTRRTQK